MKKWGFTIKKAQKLKTETWVLLLLAGILLLVIVLPTDKKKETQTEETIPPKETVNAEKELEVYIREQEKRVEEFLTTIEPVQPDSPIWERKRAICHKRALSQGDGGFSGGGRGG